MATPSAKPSPNGANSAGGPTPSRTRDWGVLRSGEPGSAFRGLTKGRGDRGRGGGRSGRGGRAGSGSSRGGRGGGDQANGTKSENISTKADAPVSVKSTPAAEPSTPSVEKAPMPAASNPPKTKANSRRGSRNVPTLILPPSSPSVETSPASASARPPNRRRRSQQHGKSPVTATSPKPGLSHGLSVEPIRSPNLLLPQRARTGPSSPKAPHKDVPPHLSAGPDVTTFDMKHNIDALVERVRAVAMDNNRPTTPGSHIDWAGDDDDSLPDLDDWGVTTSTSVIGDKETNVDISPILVDGLKTLPEPSARLDDCKEYRKAQKEDAVPAPVDIIPKVGDKAAPREKWKSKRTAPPQLPLQKDSNTAAAPKQTHSTTGPSSDPKIVTPSAIAPDATAAQTTNYPTSPTKMSESPSKLFHPSLPAKPVAAVQSLTAQARPRPGAMPMRVAVPAKQT